MNNHRERLTHLLELYEQAETQIKKAEEVNGGIIIPSINELRYVGYHLVKGFLASEDQSVASELDKAESHAKRSIYDSSESIIIFYLESAENFHVRHENSDSITEVIPAYVDYLQELEVIKTHIDAVRKEKGVYIHREQYYQDCQPYIDRLGKINSIFKQANSIIIKKDRRKTIKFIFVVLSLVAAIVGVIATVVLSR